MKKLLSTFVLLYLRFFARLALIRHKPVIIGIAGSVGKSSTRNALEAVLSQHFSTKVVSGNSETGIPLGILGIKPAGFGIIDWLNMLLRVPGRTHELKGVSYLLVEMGIDDPFPPKNMEYLLTIVKPDIAIDLNATATHTMQFEKLLVGKHIENTNEFLREKIADEDAKIITESGCELGIYNTDDFFVQQAITRAQLPGVKLLTFGEKKNNSIVYGEYLIDLKKTVFTLKYEAEEITLSFSGVMLPKAYFSVFAPAVLVAKHLGLTSNQITKALESNFTLPKGRASFLAGVNDSVIIDSSYNSSKAAVVEFLAMCKQLKEKTKREVVFLMGDMRELGNEARKEHEELIPLIHEVCDYLYCVGPLTMEYILPHITIGKRGIKEAKWFENSVNAGKYLRDTMPEKAIVLVKGSQNTIFLEEGIKEFLADKKDMAKLCRQERYWNKKL